MAIAELDPDEVHIIAYQWVCKLLLSKSAKVIAGYCLNINEQTRARSEKISFIFLLVFRGST